MIAVCLGVRSGRRDLSFRLRPSPVRIQRGLSAVFFDPLLDDTVRDRQHAIHKSREALVLG